MMKNLCAWTIMAVLSLLTAASMAAIDESLVLYYTFDDYDGGEVKDLSPHQNHGKAHGSPKVVDGVFGFGLELNGTTDSIEVPHDDSLNVKDAVTMEMWVKLDSAGPNANQAGIEKGGWETGEYSLYAFYVPGNGCAVQFKDLPEACGDANSGHLGPNLKDDTWHHLAGVWDGKKIFLYVDAELQVEVECAGGQIGENTKSVYIGARNGSERFLKGIVDEVRIYTRALSAEDVKRDMETLGKVAVSPSSALPIRWADIKKCNR